MAMIVERRMVTPPVLAKEWGVAVNKVTALIKSGELRAINLASSRDKRPRYAIPREDVDRFEASRAVVPEKPRPKRRKGTAVPDGYFPGV